MHGDMDFMARHLEIRSDPRRLMPGCRSILAVAMSYHTRPGNPVPPGMCRVSSYARGRDYHRVIKKKLLRVGKWLSEIYPKAQWRALVDTAPVLEREWAAAAGLGWIGKNTMLVNRRYGTELFLGLLLMNLELEADRPAANHCGTCSACLDACPGSAFVRPGVLDARRCIAYLTIEHRGDINGELAERIPPRLAGCDVCNEVCPFNIKAPMDLHPEFFPASHRVDPLISELESLDEPGWKEWRRGSPLNRIPFIHFRKILAIVGNRRDTQKSRDEAGVDQRA